MTCRGCWSVGRIPFRDCSWDAEVALLDCGEAGGFEGLGLPTVHGEGVSLPGSQLSGRVVERVQ